jgi:DNA-binding transcriptional ArsR family regulator
LIVPGAGGPTHGADDAAASPVVDRVRPPLDGVAPSRYICTVTQTRRQPPISPRRAAARKGPVDALLDPALFRALSDPTRVLLLACLLKCRRACTVTEIAECCSVDFSVVSRHLSTLEAAGVLESTRHGRSVTYAARCSHLSQALRRLADAVEDCGPDDPRKVGSACCDPNCDGACDGGACRTRDRRPGGRRA